MSRALPPVSFPHQITLASSNSPGQLGVISIQPRVFSFRRFAGPVFVNEPICRDEIVEQVGDVSPRPGSF
jgi:hypothetical protein